MPIIFLILLLMIISIPVIGEIVAGIVAFCLVAEGMYMFISCLIGGKN